MIIHIPHASAVIPADVRSQFLIDDDALRAELLRSTDWFTDELFAGSGGKEVVYPVSRLVVDPERFEDDAQEPMAAVGRGVVYFNCTDGSPLRRQVSASEREALLEQYYRPHHMELESATRQELSLRGSALVIDAHSFPATAWTVEPRRWSERPDFCLGTDEFHTPRELVSLAERTLRESGFGTAIDRPYSGTLIPTHFYQSDRRVSGLMIEVNRRLYMDESTGAKGPHFDAVCAVLHRLCHKLDAWHSSIAPGP